MARKKPEKKDAPIFDVGGIAVPDFDPAVFDFVATEQAAATEETRYIKPRVFQPISEEGVCYDNARDLARDVRLDFGERTDVFVSGNFIFGDFLEAYLVEHHVKCRKLLISTLSLNQNNTDRPGRPFAARLYRPAGPYSQRLFLRHGAPQPGPVHLQEIRRR